MLISRRSLFAGALATAAVVPAAKALAAPSSSWLSYEARLKARLADAGGGRFDHGFAQALLRGVNNFRAARRMRPYAWDESLAVVARAHAADMAQRNYFAHQSPEGFSPFDRASLLVRDMAGTVAENLAWRQDMRGSNPREFETLWEQSPGHRANLLHPTCTMAGYGVVRMGNRYFAAGVYAQPSVRLARPLPLRVSSQELTRDLAASHIDRAAFTRPGQNPSRLPARFAAAPALPPGVWQLRPVTPRDGNTYDVLAGPIFIV